MRSTDASIILLEVCFITSDQELITEVLAICNYLEKVANTNINSDKIKIIGLLMVMGCCMSSIGIGLLRKTINQRILFIKQLMITKNSK